MEQFTTWLAAQHQREDSVGNLARWVLADESWPGNERIFARLQRHMLDLEAGPDLHRGLSSAWAEYKQTTSSRRAMPPGWWTTEPGQTPKKRRRRAS